MRWIIILAITAHIIAEFYLTDHQREPNKPPYKMALIGILYYAITMVAAAATTLSLEVMQVFAVLIGIYALFNSIQLGWFKIAPKSVQRSEQWLFALKHFIMITAIISLVYWHKATPNPTLYTSVMIDNISLIGRYILGIIALLRPINSTFKMFYSHVKASELNKQGIIEPQDFNTGRLIGNLERLLVFTLLTVGQYGAIGLVFAAKSITRFSKLDHKPFAEYYLLGTLFSLLCTIVVYQLIMLL